MMNSKMRKIGIVLGLLLMLAAAATWAWAQDDGITYYACVNNSSGTIFVVTPDESCKSNENKIVWNQMGPAGPQGPPGADGVAGPHGHVPGDISSQGAGSGLDADTVDGLHAGQLNKQVQNVIVVAKGGGDYANVQEAIDSVADAAASNPYLVWVAPGVYEEEVAMKPYVHLQGAGQAVTALNSAASGSDPNLPQATLLLASNSSVSDLTVGNSGEGFGNVALMAPAGVLGALVENVAALSQGGGGSSYNIAILLTGSGVEVTLRQITALAENADLGNFGLQNFSGPAATVVGGSFTGRGGTDAKGIFNSGASLTAENVSVVAENGITNHGLRNADGATATLRGGSYTGRGGSESAGIFNDHSDTTLEAESITALGQGGSFGNVGMRISDGSATLSGSTFTGTGGEYAGGIYSERATLKVESVNAIGEGGSFGSTGLSTTNSSSTLRGGSFAGNGGEYASGIYADGGVLEAESVSAVAAGGSSGNSGLFINSSATAAVHGGSFSGRGGVTARGIAIENGAILEAASVSALAENGGSNNGLQNADGSATLYGGSFTGRGGADVSGITIVGAAVLEAEHVSALADNGDSNDGLRSHDGAVSLRGGSFTGRGGTYARGINIKGAATLEAEHVSIRGEDGSSHNFGLYNDYGQSATVTQSVLEGATHPIFGGGSVAVSNSRLSGGTINGAVTCVSVSSGAVFYANGCP